jgi:hypothetical protein
MTQVYITCCLQSIYSTLIYVINLVSSLPQFLARITFTSSSGKAQCRRGLSSCPCACTWSSSMPALFARGHQGWMCEKGKDCDVHGETEEAQMQATRAVRPGKAALVWQRGPVWVAWCQCFICLVGAALRCGGGAQKNPWRAFKHWTW